MGVPDNFPRWKGLNGVLGFKGHQITLGDQLRPAGWIRRLCRPLHRVELNGKSLLFAPEEPAWLPSSRALLSAGLHGSDVGACDQSRQVFDRVLPREGAAKRYRTMEERGASRTLLRVVAERERLIRKRHVAARSLGRQPRQVDKSGPFQNVSPCRAPHRHAASRH